MNVRNDGIHIVQLIGPVSGRDGLQHFGQERRLAVTVRRESRRLKQKALNGGIVLSNHHGIEQFGELEQSVLGIVGRRRHGFTADQHAHDKGTSVDNFLDFIGILQTSLDCSDSIKVMFEGCSRSHQSADLVSCIQGKTKEVVACRTKGSKQGNNGGPSGGRGSF